MKERIVKIEKYKYFLTILLFGILFSAHPPSDRVINNDPFSIGSNNINLFSDDGYTNPMNDRAKGYAIQGVVKNCILNYGNYIDWDYNPSGGWAEYAYLPNVSFVTSVSKISCNSNPGKRIILLFIINGV